MPQLFAEPDLNEDKPSFDAVPAPIVAELEKLFGNDKIASGQTAYGGYSVSAAYVVRTVTNRYFFVKGSHPGEMAHGAENLRQEMYAYRFLPALQRIAPAFIGVVSDGNEDGWMLGVWEYLEPVPPPRGSALLGYAIEALVMIQSEAQSTVLTPAINKNFVQQFFIDDRKWRRLQGDAAVREKFLSLFADRSAAEGWLQNNIQRLVDLQAEVGSLGHPEGLIHGDLRVDNLLFTRGGLRIIDWPNACRGPLVFDPVFLFAHLAALGVSDIDASFARYESAGGVAFDRIHQHIMMASLAGYFADQAYREETARLPRLRWMQKSMLVGLLQGLAARGLIESPPAMYGQGA